MMMSIRSTSQSTAPTLKCLRSALRLSRIPLRFSHPTRLVLFLMSAHRSWELIQKFSRSAKIPLLCFILLVPIDFSFGTARQSKFFVRNLFRKSRWKKSVADQFVCLRAWCSFFGKNALTGKSPLLFLRLSTNVNLAQSRLNVEILPVSQCVSVPPLANSFSRFDLSICMEINDVPIPALNSIIFASRSSQTDETQVTPCVPLVSLLSPSLWRRKQVLRRCKFLTRLRTFIVLVWECCLTSLMRKRMRPWDPNWLRLRLVFSRIHIVRQLCRCASCAPIWQDSLLKRFLSNSGAHCANPSRPPEGIHRFGDLIASRKLVQSWNWHHWHSSK